MTTVATLPPHARRSVASRTWAFVKRHALTVYALLVVGYLMLPIAVVIMFSFNHPTGRFNYVWNEFTFSNWLNWNDVLGIKDAIVTSLEVGLLATIVATALGTLMAMAIVRHHFVGRGVQRNVGADAEPAEVQDGNRMAVVVGHEAVAQDGGRLRFGAGSGKRGGS